MRLNGMKFCVDAGHGGTDPGATATYNGSTIYEKNLALTFAQSVKSYLEADGATVYMTRNSDVSVTNSARWELGRDNSVDAFISIHWNSGSTTAHGTETFYANTRSGDSSFATALQDNIIAYLGTNDRGVKNDTQAAVGSLGVLRNPSQSQYTYPRALIEVEFMSNSTAMANLDYPLYEASLDFAAGVLNGVREYFGK